MFGGRCGAQASLHLHNLRTVLNCQMPNPRQPFVSQIPMVGPTTCRMPVKIRGAEGGKCELGIHTAISLIS